MRKSFWAFDRLTRGLLSPYESSRGCEQTDSSKPVGKVITKGSGREKGANEKTTKRGGL